MNSILSFDPSQLLELRTKAGAIYLSPSPIECLRLRWTFRHFRILPSRVLSRYDQRLIDRLCQSAVVTPSRPVPADEILGVIETSNPASPVHPLAPGLSKLDDRSLRWGILCAVATAAICMAGLTITARSIFHRVPSIPVAHAAGINQALPMPPADTTEPAFPPSAQVATKPEHIALVPARPVKAGNPSAAVAVGAAAPVPDSEPVAVETRAVTELPRGHFARPVGQSHLVGEVQLKALIAPDGSVQQVTVVSGNPKLAEAGIRAVRQWHYSPYQVEGQPTQEETRIKMNFFGPDAVSIASQP